jgi:hypothetical protein
MYTTVPASSEYHPESQQGCWNATMKHVLQQTGVFSVSRLPELESVSVPKELKRDFGGKSYLLDLSPTSDLYSTTCSEELKTHTCNPGGT